MTEARSPRRTTPCSTPGRLATGRSSPVRADAAPGCGGATYSTVFSGMAYAGTSINAAGQVMFQSSLAGPGVVTANDMAWFTGSIGNVQLMLRKGDLAPGGEQVSAIGTAAQMNAAGQVLIEVTFAPGAGTHSRHHRERQGPLDLHAGRGHHGDPARGQCLADPRHVLRQPVAGRPVGLQRRGSGALGRPDRRRHRRHQRQRSVLVSPSSTSVVLRTR